jgi:hypothetical protein
MARRIDLYELTDTDSDLQLYLRTIAAITGNTMLSMLDEAMQQPKSEVRK